MDARRLLDRMPPGQSAQMAVPPVAEGGGSIDALPDSVFEHILGFLPSAEAVQTSVLARRWRHLWKSATGLRTGRPLDEGPMSVEELRSVVNHQLVLRHQGLPLDTCEITIAYFSDEDDVCQVNLWFQQAVMCSARMLRIYIHSDWLELDNLPLVSEHLTRLELGGVRLHNRLLNFSRCPALEYLKIDFCDLSLATRIVSDSIKYQCITPSNISVLLIRCSAVTPAFTLVSLRLDYLHGRTPMLYSMPSLEEAFVRMDGQCNDRCNAANYETCDCESCDNFDNMADGSCNSVLLKGLSEAKNLALISNSETFIFKRDLRRCPMFQRLKTLVLNDYWCVPDEFCALACILEHSPVLEKLTLQLRTKRLQPEVEMNPCVCLTKRSAAISEYLKKVVLKCDVIDDSVLKVLKFLSTYNIYANFE